MEWTERIRVIAEATISYRLTDSMKFFELFTEIISFIWEYLNKIAIIAI